MLKNTRPLVLLSPGRDFQYLLSFDKTGPFRSLVLPINLLQA
jgi:hypothetical protein